jgi:hypothetical protein
MSKAWACDDLAEDGGLSGAEIGLVLVFWDLGKTRGLYHVARVEEFCSRDCRC